MSQRNVWVDYAKAIGIILVVYGHMARGVYHAGIDIPIRFYELTDSIIYSFHMPLFFFLSGLFFYHSFQKRGSVKLINSKIDTIVYPYIIWSLMQGFIEAFLSDYTNGNTAYSDVLFLWSPRAQFWFLYVLFFCFVVTAVIFTIKSHKTAIIVFLLSVIIYLYPGIFTSFHVTHLFANSFVFFTFGIVFSLYFKENRLSQGRFVILLAIVFVVCQFFYQYTFGTNYPDRTVASLLLAIVSISFIVSLSSWAALKPNKFIIFIGTSSMAIYLMHILAGSGARVMLKTFMGVDSYVYHLIVECLVGLFLPLLTVVIINKYKIPYIFSAPMSQAIAFVYSKVSPRVH